MRERILSQKREIDGVYKEVFVPREVGDSLEKALSTDLIKVITGPRRSGKTFLAFQVLRGHRYGYLNFDDEVLSKVKDKNMLLKLLHEVYGDFNILFIDEVQNVPEWEVFVNRLKRLGYNLVITGSSSNLLSKELASRLTGRYVETSMLTFSFREFLQAKRYDIKTIEDVDEIGKGHILSLLREYLGTGGYPEIVVKNYDPVSYPRTLFESIIYKDVVRRYNVRYGALLHDLAFYLVTNTARETSYRKLTRTLEIGSVHTIENYLRYLEEAYIVKGLQRYTSKTKQRLRAPRKIYLIDNSFMNIEYSTTDNMGARFENTVFQELYRRIFYWSPQTSLYYWKDPYGKEVDFLLKKGARITQLIQATIELTTDNYNREVNNLLKASERLGCKNLTIITWDQEETIQKNNRKIQVIPLWKWLLQQKTTNHTSNNKW